jgi:hypothetical protein
LGGFFINKKKNPATVPVKSTRCRVGAAAGVRPPIAEVWSGGDRADQVAGARDEAVGVAVAVSEALEHDVGVVDDAAVGDHDVLDRREARRRIGGGVKRILGSEQQVRLLLGEAAVDAGDTAAGAEHSVPPLWCVLLQALVKTELELLLPLKAILAQER